MTARVLVVGQSNMAAVSRAAEAMIAQGTMPASIAMTFMQLLAPRYRPYFTKDSLNPAILHDLRAKLDKADIVLSCLGGNAHSVFGLVNHKTPYDFVLDSAPSRPLGLDREVVPCHLVRAALRDFMLDANNFSLLDAVKSQASVPMLHSESPAPIPSETHIRQNGRKLEARIAEYGVAPADLRWKLWRLQSELYAEHCNKAGISFLPVPRQTLDDRGMLTESAWGADPTHGNNWFGSQIILQLADHLASTR